MSNIRYDLIGKLTLMTEKDGYVMIRRPGAMPMVITTKKWESLSVKQVELAKESKQ